MTTEHLGDVRNELNTRSTRTTLDELKKKGLEQVRVIRSSQILDLIEKAVERALAKRGEVVTPAGKAELTQNSAEIFRELVRTELQNARGAEQKQTDEMLGELRALRQQVSKSPPPPRAEPAAAARMEGSDSNVLKEKLDSLGAELASKIERIGRKVGVQPLEETPADIAGLFTSIPELESNLNDVEAEERKSSDVTDALARMKSLRHGSAGT